MRIKTDPRFVPVLQPSKRNPRKRRRPVTITCVPEETRRWVDTTDAVTRLVVRIRPFGSQNIVRVEHGIITVAFT